MHYTAAHYYNPDKAQFQDFEPFWEFVSGPLHAGTFGPNDLDNTFGPEVKFIKTTPLVSTVRICRRPTACSSSVMSRSTAAADR